jgi:hypothetical protein
MNLKKIILTSFMFGVILFNIPNINQDRQNIDFMNQDQNPYKSAVSDVGSVWMENLTIKEIGQQIRTIVYVNTGAYKLAAYGFKFFFNQSVIQVNEIVAGEDGFLVAYKIDNSIGAMNVTGFTIFGGGYGPSAALRLLNITWNVKTLNSGNITIHVDSLTDENTNNIGTPNGITASVKISESNNQEYESSQNTTTTGNNQNFFDSYGMYAVIAGVAVVVVIVIIKSKGKKQKNHSKRDPI